jgi:hypothetical protein
MTRKMYTGKELVDCFANLHMTINNEIRTVKQEIKETNERVGVLESHAELVNDLIKTLNEETVPNLEDKLNEEANERIRLELWGRKWNIVISGIEGTLNETPRVTEKKVIFFETVLRMPTEETNYVLLQAVHRLPGGTYEQKRRIVVRFNSLIVRDEILAAAMKLKKGSGYSVVPDVSPSVTALRSKLLSQRRGMPPEEQRKTLLVYLKTYPFVALRKRNQ